MLTLLTLLLAMAVLPLTAATEPVACSSPPRPILAPSHADAVYFLFVIDNSWPEEKIAQQKALYQMIACEIPRSPKYRVGTIYAYEPKRDSHFELDEKSLTTADHFTSTLDDAIEMSYSSRVELPYDRSRCSRMHRVVEVMKLADFSYDSSVHTHYIFPTDDSEDDFVNDCDPAWTFKQSARNILNEATPNHLYLDVIRIGTAKRWTQYGERVQLADWSDRSINQRDVSHLVADFLDGALKGDAVNEVIVFATSGLERIERPKGLMTFLTTPPPPSTTSTTTTTAVKTSTSREETTTHAVTNATTILATAAVPAKRGRKKALRMDGDETATKTLAAAAVLPAKRGRKKALRMDVDETGIDEVQRPINTAVSQDPSNSRARRNTTGQGRHRATPKVAVPEKHVVFGYQTPFSTAVFYIVVIVTTVVVVVIVWIVCGLVFYCCYRDDGSLKRHERAEAEDEDEMMLISGLHDNDWERPSSMMISDHLRKVKEERYQEEQLRSSESRGTISVEK